MTQAERVLFEEMISHSIKSQTESEAHLRDYHREMYTLTKRVLWDFQEESRENDENT